MRVHRVGICGTDISGYLGKMPFFSYPRIPGHELGVEVLAVGYGVTNVKPGDNCSVEPYMNCGHCHACRKGASNCCANLKVLGVMTDGGLCDRFVLPATSSSLGSSRSINWRWSKRSRSAAMPLIVRAAARRELPDHRRGADRVIRHCLCEAHRREDHCAGHEHQRLEFCKSVMGVDETLVPGDQLEQDLRRVTDGSLPDVVIDATGSNVSMSNAFGYVAPTGRLVYVGITTKEITFKHTTFHRPEGTLLCSRNALPRDFSRIINLIETGKIDTRPWITHRTPFGDVPAQFESFTKPETGVIKAVIEVI